MPPRKHTIDKHNQGSLLALPQAAIDHGLFKEEGSVYFPAEVPERAARLTALLDSLSHLMELNAGEGMIKAAHVPDLREDMVERMGSGDRLASKLEDKEANKPWREERARERFEYASGHDKRLKRMSPEAAAKVTDKAFENFKNKYAVPGSTKAAKNRYRLRAKVDRLISKS